MNPVDRCKVLIAQVTEAHRRQTWAALSQKERRSVKLVFRQRIKVLKKDLNAARASQTRKRRRTESGLGQKMPHKPRNEVYRDDQAHVQTLTRSSKLQVRASHESDQSIVHTFKSLSMERQRPIKRRRGLGPNGTVHIKAEESESEDGIEFATKSGATQGQETYPSYRGTGKQFTLALRPKNDNHLPSSTTSIMQHTHHPNTEHSWHSSVIRKILERNYVSVPKEMPCLLTIQDIGNLLRDTNSMDIVLWRKPRNVQPSEFQLLKQQIIALRYPTAETAPASSTLPPTLAPTSLSGESYSNPLRFNEQDVRRVLTENKVDIKAKFPTTPTAHDIALLIDTPEKIATWQRPKGMQRVLWDVIKDDLISGCANCTPTALSHVKRASANADGARRSGSESSRYGNKYRTRQL